MPPAEDARGDPGDADDVTRSLGHLADSVARLQYDLELARSLDGDLDHLQGAVDQALHRPPDLVSQRFTGPEGQEGLVLFLKGAVDRTLAVRGVLDRLSQGDWGPAAGGGTLLDRVVRHVAPVGTAVRLARLDELLRAVLDGAVVVALAGSREALGLPLEKRDKRSIEPPKSEPVVLGPHDGFIEDAATNLGLIRRRLKTPRLWIDTLRLGTLTGTQVYVLHLHGVADDRLVEEVRARLARIRMDGVVTATQLAEQIRDAPFSPFPTLQRTERPDHAVAGLLEGRVAVVTDGSPFVILVPSTLPGQMKSTEDYTLHWLIATAIRTVRWAALFVSLFLPPVYVAVTTYHQEFLPTPLLVTLAATRENVPLPTLLEVILLLFLFEIIREAGTRVPQGIGQALTIGGTLVVGQGAVRAGIISAPVVIVAAAVVIAMFAIPNYELLQVTRLVLYPLVLSAGLLGIYGIFFSWIIVLLHLSSLRSFGVCYLQPLAPIRLKNWKDFILRTPWFWMRTRPAGFPTVNPVREEETAPPHPPRSPA